MKIVIGIVMLALLAATACDVSGAVMSLEGPDTIAKDKTATYEVTTTGLTPAGVVEYFPYINLNDDEFIDEDEVIGGFIRVAPVDADGVASYSFYLNPAEFFESRELEVPDTTTVYVYAQWYLSPDNIFPIDTVSKELEITED